MRRAWIILAFFLLPTILHSPQSVYVSEGNIFDGRFNNPVETLYVICFNGHYYSLSTQEANQISISPFFLKTFLEERGYTLKDVAILMHNHFYMPMLSYPDRNSLLKLRNYGFRGSFGIYITSTDTVLYDRPWLREIR